MRNNSVMRPGIPTVVQVGYATIYNTVASKPGGPGGGTGPPLFCNAVSNENNMKKIEITNGLIFKNLLHSLLPGFQ